MKMYPLPLHMTLVLQVQFTFSTFNGVKRLDKISFLLGDASFLKYLQDHISKISRTYLSLPPFSSHGSDTGNHTNIRFFYRNSTE